MDESQANDWAARRIMIALAGRIGERRALRGSEPGWVRVLTPQQLICHHEAAHGVVAVLLGWHVYELNLHPDPALKVETGAPVLAFCSTGTKAERPVCNDCVWNSDGRTVALFSLLAAPAPGGWLGAIRVIHKLRAEVAGLIEKYWFEITVLAWELERHGELDREQIRIILRTITGSRASVGRG